MAKKTKEELYKIRCENLRKAKEAGKLGRPKGKKSTESELEKVKEAYLKVYKKLGGEEALYKWAVNVKNTEKFFKLLLQLLSKEKTATDAKSSDMTVIYTPERKDIQDG